LHFPYTWSFSWVDLYVFIMFRNSLVLALVWVTVFLWCFIWYIPSLLSHHSKFHQLYAITLQCCKQATPCLKMWWLETSFNIQYISYQVFIKIREKRKQATNDVKTLRALICLSYTWLLFWVNFYVFFMFHNFIELTLVLVSLFLSCFIGDFRNHGPQNN
jgi:hypothetical protein